MSLDDKISKSYRLIDKCLDHYRNPVIACSFGKDSMVILHMVRSQNLPVLFFRDPFFPDKYEFANQVIRDWELSVYDYPPMSTSVAKGNGNFEIMFHHQIGNQQIHRGMGIIPPNGGLYLCGYKDLYQRPLGLFNFPWDLIFHGHKNSDIDPTHGPVPISMDIKQQEGAPAAAYPLREWSDEDVWGYIYRFNVPYNQKRYDYKDLTANSDFFPACVKCMDRDEPDTVMCPKLGVMVSNISRELRS